MMETRVRKLQYLRAGLGMLTLLLIPLFAAACGTLEVGIEPADTRDDAGATSVATMSAEATPGTTSPPPETATLEPTPTPIYGPFALHVAFVKDGNVWLWTEKQEAVSLTATGGVEDVKISADGAVIAFTRGGELWVINRDGTGERPLVTAEEFVTIERREPEFGVALHRYAWVGRTHNLAFNTRLDTGYGLVLNDDLHLVNADTAELKVLFPPGQGGEFIYSPDGSQVAVATPSGVFLADADGGNLREVFTYTAVATASEYQYYPQPVWSADSSSLRVAIAPPDPYVERPQTSIWALHNDGTPAHLIGSIEVAPGSEPVFSAYLSQLAYIQLPGDGRPADQGSVVLADLTGGEMIGDSVAYYPEAHRIYGYAPEALRFAFLTNPENPQAMLGQLGAEAVPALADGESIAIDVRWIDADRYLVLASSGAGGWDIILGAADGSTTYVVTVSGPPPAYDFAAPVTSASTPVESDSGGSRIPFGLIYQTGDGLWHVNADGESVRIFEFPDASGNPWPAVSPNGTQVLYTEADDIWLADIATGERRNLTQTPGRGECCAQWWPNQPDAVLLSSWAPENVGPSFGFPTVMRLDGADERPREYRFLAEGEVSFALPAPSPDGQTMAYDRAGQPWLYRADTGSEPFDWTLYGLPGDRELRVVSPAWSPDGRRLVWIVGDCGAGQCQTSIGVFDLKAQAAQFLHPHTPVGRGGQPLAPVWSPDGRWLAFVAWAENADRAGLWVARVDGQEEEHPLATGQARATAALAWSPDGRWLAFSSTLQPGGAAHWLAEVGAWELHPLDLPSDAHILDWTDSQQ